VEVAEDTEMAENAGVSEKVGGEKKGIEDKMMEEV
jgi:hypothetical protein